jgi:hypothetical protein
VKILSWAFILIIPVSATATDMRGNLNISYQATESGAENAVTSTFSQVLNAYIYDRFFYKNDLMLGAYIFKSKVSTRDRGDLRVRYSASLTGYRYNFYSSFSPYTIYRPFGSPEKVRVFQSSLSLSPMLLPAVNSSYSSTSQYTADTPQSKKGLNYSWNIGTSFSKAFGTFRGVYQRQHGRVDRPIPQRQTLQTVNFGYDVSRRLPQEISGAASYSFTGSRLDMPPGQEDDTRTHNGALQGSKGFGRWVSLSASSSGRLSEYERGDHINRINDIYARGAANVALRDNLSLALMRGYSSSENRNDTTTTVVNDYMSLSAQYSFGATPNGQGRLVLSRGIYFESAVGRNYVSNAAAVLDFEIYRETEATLNLGLSHNSRTVSNQGSYQMLRTFNIITRPLRSMNINFGYQSTQSSNKMDFIKTDSDNLSLNMVHTLKWYFNYSATYTRSSYRTAARNVASSLTLVVNYRLSRNMTLLSSYSRRELGQAGDLQDGAADEAISGRLTWALSRRSNLTMNYAVSDPNGREQSQSYGGYFAINF